MVAAVYVDFSFIVSFADLHFSFLLLLLLFTPFSSYLFFTFYFFAFLLFYFFTFSLFLLFSSLFAGNFVLIEEGPWWLKALFIYALFFLLLSAFMCIMNLCWSFVKGPEDDRNKNIIMSKNNLDNINNVNSEVRQLLVHSVHGTNTPNNNYDSLAGKSVDYQHGTYSNI